MNTLKLLGPGLLKKEKKVNSNTKIFRTKKNAQRLKRAASVELFLREILGTRLIQMEKKF
ncbi:MAG: hypothetical protein H7177_14900 [Rhizobacter sp.]|nr:hypothetical protein [Bacteriovorax sp.]